MHCGIHFVLFFTPKIKMHQIMVIHIDGVTCMFINKPQQGIELSICMAKAISLYCSMIYPCIIEFVAGFFKPRALMVRTHTAGQSFVLTICFALQWRQGSPHLYDV